MVKMRTNGQTALEYLLLLIIAIIIIVGVWYWVSYAKVEIGVTGSEEIEYEFYNREYLEIESQISKYLDFV